MKKATQFLREAMLDNLAVWAVITSGNLQKLFISILDKKGFVWEVWEKN